MELRLVQILIVSHAESMFKSITSYTESIIHKVNFSQYHAIQVNHHCAPFEIELRLCVFGILIFQYMTGRDVEPCSTLKQYCYFFGISHNLKLPIVLTNSCELRSMLSLTLAD